MSQSGGPFQFDPPSPEALEALLPNYAFEGLIAKGGMGAVYKARQITLDRDVAVKILPRELGSDPEFRTGFETEARAMAKLNHPNLVGVYDSGSVDGMPFLVMEYIHGKSLYHSAFRRKVDPVETVRLIQGILEGLGHAHEHGIIHRDIKPANILLTPKAEPKIGDFGLARHLDTEAPGLVMGTPGYTAPEVIKNPQTADRRADIYAVGVILYELLTGQQQKPGCQPPSAVAKSPNSLDAVWQRSTHPNPAFRYADAHAMSIALDAAIKHLRPGGTVLRKSTGGASRLLTPGAPAKPRPAPTQPPPPAPSAPVIVPLAEPNADPAAEAPAVAALEPESPPEDPPCEPLATAIPAAIPAPSGPLAPPAAAPNEAPAPPPQPQPIIVNTEIRSNWGLVIKFLIIALLLVTVAFTWKALEKHKKAVAETNRRTAAENAQREMQAAAAREALARQQAEEAAKPKPDPSKPAPPPPKTPEPESPMQSLERLRRDLASGGRAEMPAGTTRRGDYDFFLVTTPLSWHEASFFAERHGGHLALPLSDEDLTWLSESTAKADAQAVWIGAGRDEGEQWVLLDGTVWKLSNKPRGAGHHAAVTRLGLVRGTPASETLPFYIQWHRDGSNPATLNAMLQRTRQSLAQPDPDFPPGTATFQNRHYLLVPRAMTWGQAADLAEQAGGHLAVPSDQAEAIWLEEFLKEQHPGPAVWIGGRRSRNTWEWQTGEPWTFARWNKDHPPAETATQVAVAPDGVWSALTADETAPALLIEWSPDRQSTNAKTTDVAPLASGLAPLQQKARELITAAAQDRDSQLAANARTYVWDIEVWFRGLSKSDQTIWNPHVQKLKSLAKNNRVPREILAEDGVQMSPRMAAIAQYCSRKQAEIDAAYVAKMTKIRDGYLAKIRQQLTEAEQRGQSDLARSLRAAARAASVDPDDLPDVLGSAPGSP